MIEEALEQVSVLTQEDLGRALKVSARTIRRGVQALEAGDGRTRIARINGLGSKRR